MKLYELLGVARDATEEQIKRAYRKLAKRLHPDMPGGDKEKFAAINHAHAVLTDAARRAHYDLTGDDLPKPPTDELQAKAQDMLAHLLRCIIADAGADIVSAPVISLMRDHLVKAQKELDKRIEKHKHDLAKAEGLAPRFKRKPTAKSDTNIMSALARNFADECKRHIESNEAAKPTMARALELVLDHTFDPLLVTEERATYAQQRGVAGLFNNMFGGAVLGGSGT